MPGRTYVSGWTTRVERGDAVNRSTISDIGKGSGKATAFTNTSDENSFAAIRAKCLASNTLWEDPEFPAAPQSLFFTGPPPDWPQVEWLRPKQICPNPQMFTGGASRMDIVQGALGDCWLLAAVACLTTEPELLNEVVPADQSFDQDYAGVFRFHFWQYGRWVEVLIDDRLPCWKGRKQLVYMHSADRNEFWSALIEKAYAKLNGCYESLKGGVTTEALTDFTGGIAQIFELRDKAPADLWKTLMKAKATDSLMGCSLSNHPSLKPEDKGKIESKLTNGLIIGHAYSITDVREVTVKTPSVAGSIQLLRIRNPWGNEAEWKGAWSDSSREWQLVPQEERQELGLTFSNDGEFWMSFKDFVKEFERLEICLLGPDSISSPNRTWKSTFVDGGWKPKVNAGGCPNPGNPWWTNPQYRVTVVDPDPDDDDGTGTVIVGVMQKARRKLRREGLKDLSIGYSIYKLINKFDGTLDAQLFKTHSTRFANSKFTTSREVSEAHKLPPGEYVIIPSTFHPDTDGDYILRIYSESAANTATKESDEATGFTAIQKDNLSGAKKAEDKNIKDEGRQAFVNLAGADGKIDAYELQNILNAIFKKEFQFDGFSTDMTRSMVAMCDADLSGKLEFEDFKNLLADMKACSRAFRTMDTDGSGYFSSYELRTALTYLGYKVSNATFNAIVMRYSDKEGHITFDNFVAIYMKLKSIFESFKKKDPSGTGQAVYNANEFTVLTMYS